jgi:hypothetical protein
MNKRVYKGNIVNILQGLSDRNYQERVWLNINNLEGLVDSFVEAVCMLFDDCVVGDYLKEGEILFDLRTTNALHELDVAIGAVKASDENGQYRSQEEIINDPLMQVVREKAAKALELIEASDGRESTVEIIE